MSPPARPDDRGSIPFKDTNTLALLVSFACAFESLRRNANATVQCPVAPGPYEVTQTVDLPREIPHAKFTVGIHGFNADEKDMLCATIVVDFMKGRS